MKVQVRERDLVITEAERLVAQSVNEYTVQFTFDPAWDGYAVEAVFQDQSGVLKAKVISDGAAVIPWEVLRETGYIRIGVFAVTSSNTRPTVWSALIPVYEGAEDGDPSTPTASTPWQEALLQMGQDVTAAAAAKTAAETAQGIAERAAAMAAASSGTATFALNDAGHLIVTWTDTEGTSHNTDIGEVSAYAVAVKNGYSGTEEQWEAYIANASTNAAAAAASALVAEGYADGKQNGTAVESGSDYYHNNAKYYSEQAATSATAAQEAAGTASAAYGTDLLAPNYGDLTPPIAAGQHCIHSGDYYECISPITEAEEWTAAHWKQVTVGGETSDLKSAIDKLDGRFQNGINFFNPNDPEIELNVELKSTGATAEKTGYFASAFYPIKPGESFCANFPVGTYGSGSFVVVYNANKERLSYHSFTAAERLTDDRGYNYVTWTVPITGWEGVAYFRLTGVMSAMHTYMYVYADEMPTAYTPYTDKVTLSDDVIVPFENLDNVSVSKEDTDFISDTSVNLVDLSALVPGILTNSSSNGNIDTSGNYGTNWVTTDYIPVEPGETYALCIFPGVNYGSSYAGVPYYDENKNFLGRVKQPGGSVAAIASRVTITLPSNSSIRYIRTSYYKSYTDSTGSDHKRWWQCQIFHATAWPTDMYVPFDGSNKIAATRLDDVYSAKYNPLWGKTAMWNGDSICAADSDTGAGWAGRIATANGMSYKNYGISGGTIAENTGSGVHSVSATLDTMISSFPNADYIIIEGGTNDADIIGTAGLGTYDSDDFSAVYIEALDKDTFSGALESIFYRLVTQMKTKHIGYLIPQKMGHTAELVTRRRVFFDRAIDICKKWGIPYLDLWNGLYFNWELSAHWDQTMTSAENEAAGNLYIDGQHLTTTGYAVESPVIAAWMKTI